MKVITSFIVICLVGIGFSQTETVGGEKLASFAEGALKKYSTDVVTKETFKKFGFKTLEESKIAKLGRPIEKTMIGLSDLQAYSESKPAKGIVKKTNIFWYPVLVNGDITLKMEIMKKGDKLIPAAFGKSNSSKRTGGVIKRLPSICENANLSAPKSIKLLEIPALFATFIYFEEDDKEYLVPAMNAPYRFKLENGTVHNASALLLKLSEYAQKVEKDKLR